MSESGRYRLNDNELSRLLFLAELKNVSLHCDVISYLEELLNEIPAIDESAWETEREKAESKLASIKEGIMMTTGSTLQWIWRKITIAEAKSLIGTCWDMKKRGK